MVPIATCRCRFASYPAGDCISSPLAGWRERLMDPVHGADGRGSCLGRVRLDSRANRSLDVLAWDAAACRLARAWSGRYRRPVGEARVPPSRTYRVGSAIHQKAEWLLCLHVAEFARHVARQSHSSRAMVFLSRLRPLSRLFERAATVRSARSRRSSRRRSRSVRRGVRPTLFAKDAVADRARTGTVTSSSTDVSRRRRCLRPRRCLAPAACRRRRTPSAPATWPWENPAAICSRVWRSLFCSCTLRNARKRVPWRCARRAREWFWPSSHSGMIVGRPVSAHSGCPWTAAPVRQ